MGALRVFATSRSTWAQGLGGGFDAPHAAYVSTSTEGSGVGKPSEPPVAGTRSKPVSVSKSTLRVLVNGEEALEVCMYLQFLYKTIITVGSGKFHVEAVIPMRKRLAFNNSLGGTFFTSSTNTATTGML